MFEELSKLLGGHVEAILTFVSGAIAVFFLKRPEQRNKIDDENFKAVIEGYENVCRAKDEVIKQQASRMVVLEEAAKIALEYEAELVKRCREADRIILRGTGR